MFSHISFALKDILPAHIPAVSCIMFGLLGAGEQGEAEDYMASSILFMREHPSSDRCPCGVEADFPLEMRIKQSCQKRNLPFKHAATSKAERWVGCACPGREEAMAMNPEPQAGPRWQHWQSTAVLSPLWSLVSVRVCLFITSSQCSRVWSELIQNVGYTAKNCWERSCFHCTECELKEVQI